MTLQEAYAHLAAAQVAYNGALIVEALARTRYEAAKPPRPTVNYTEDPVAIQAWMQLDDAAAEAVGFDAAIRQRICAETDLMGSIRDLVIETGETTDAHLRLMLHRHYHLIRPLVLNPEHRSERLTMLCAAFPVPQFLEARAC
ncbi:MAG: hypothetical protein QM757_26510 [Paludibaculum sp.]